MASKVRTAAGALALLAAPLAGQHVVPARMAGVEGGSGTSIPFGLDKAARYQCVYDPVELPFTGPMFLNGIALRPDNTVPGTTSYASKPYLRVSLAVSSTTRQAHETRPTFAENLGHDATTVIVQRLVSLPAVGPVASGPMPFAADFPFDQPWLFDSSPVIHGRDPRGFVFDLRVEVQPTGNYRLDSPINCSIPSTGWRTSSSRCRLFNGNLLDLAASESVLAGGRVTYTVAGMNPGTPFSVMVSTSRTGTLFAGSPVAGPVPYDLSTFALNASQVGAPGCFVEIVQQASVGGVAGASGSGSVSFPIPAGRSFVGLRTYAQALAFDPGANPLFTVVSGAVGSEVCGPLGVARVFAFADQASSLPDSGQIDYGNAAILEVR